MKKGYIIYHGSSVIIEKPQFGFGNLRNDYGLGFYCTEDIDLAKEWGVTDGKDGYANKYELDANGLSCLDLSDPKYNVLHWITILLENRVFTLKNDITKVGKKYLIENFSIPYDNYDVIKGYRADDSYFSYAEAFLNNTISFQRLAEPLRLGNLGEQIVIKSQKAFDSLKFLGYEMADADVYYPLRKQRNEKARLEFLSDKRGAFDPNSLYLNEILRGGIKPDDPRIR